MIVLNEEKELVRVETWEEITERPGFTDNLNPHEHELSKIIGQYAFQNMISCGLSNCHTPHSRGYLVATKSGQETNIGKDCGKNYFGVDFVDMAARFDRDMSDKEARERLWSFTFELDGIKATIKDLREGEHGADWVHRTSRPLVEPGKQVPIVVIRHIAAMLKTGTSALQIDREATQQEYEMEEARSGRSVKRPLIMSDKVADIRAIEALDQANDLRQILILDLEENIKSFEPLNIDTMTSKELFRWSKWTGTLKQRLDTARQSLEAGRALLKRTNLAPFMQVIEDADEREGFTKYLNSLP